MEGLTVTGVTLTEALRREILETAINAGHAYAIGYWAEILFAETADNTADGPIVSITVREHDAYIGEGGTLREARTVKITTEMLDEAVLKLLNTKGENLQAVHDAGAWCGRLFDQDGLDGPLADVIIQMAAFGEIIYG